MSRNDEQNTDIVVERTAPPARSDRVRLVLFWDENTRSVDLVAGGTTTIGRAESCAVPIDHRSVSRLHAAIHVGDTVLLEDLGSANGTFVDGRRLSPTERVPLPFGVVGKVGRVSFVVVDDRDERRGDTRAREDDARRQLDQLVDLVATSDISVIVQAETGAGKEVLAARIHGGSARAKGPFVRLNCAALADSILESELFGHERGAFTGAAQTKIGLLEAAHEGTLFLDEIGEMALPTQAKLLRVIEAREVTRLGSVKPIAIDVRFIAATHRDLPAMVESGAFRRDLFFRLNGISLSIPPLRERVSEIDALARTFADEAARRSGVAPVAISGGALGALRAHSWPGNIRELKNVMERAFLLARGGPIDVSHVDLGRPSLLPAAAPSTPSMPPPAPVSGKLPAELAEIERARIVEALEKAGGNQTEAAKLLGISRRTLVYRLDTYDVPRPRKR